MADTPWTALGQAAIGGVQALVNGQKAHRAQKELQSMVDNYQPNQSIQDYYSKALAKYNTNPYTSQLYNAQKENIGRGTAQGLQAFGDRRSALAGIGTLIQNQNDSLLKAAATAEGQQGQNLAQLGQAAGAKTAEDKYKFENKYNLLATKAGAANEGVNSGLQNIFGGLGAVTDYANINKIYGKK